MNRGAGGGGKGRGAEPCGGEAEPPYGAGLAGAGGGGLNHAAIGQTRQPDSAEIAPVRDQPSDIMANQAAAVLEAGHGWCPW